MLSTFSGTIPQDSPLLKTQPQTIVQVDIHGPIIISQATTVYSLPGTKHALIQGESSNYSFLQGKYINTAIRNNTDSISARDNIANPVTNDNAYTSAKLRRTLFSFIADTYSTSYVLDNGSNLIILNDAMKFKVLHPCNDNVKCIE